MWADGPFGTYSSQSTSQLISLVDPLRSVVCSTAVCDRATHFPGLIFLQASKITLYAASMVTSTGDDVFIHIGRGGAGTTACSSSLHIHENATLTIEPGNVTNSSVKESRRPSHSADSQSFRQGFGQRRFSTGIGGSGNMTAASQLEKQNEAEETSRLLYDMQAPGIVLLDEGYHTGRGKVSCPPPSAVRWRGSRPTDCVAGGSANKYQPTEDEIDEARQNNENIRRQSLASINKRRESLASSSAVGSPSSSWNSRRMSITDSMKDLFKGRSSSKA
jgi:hypothetical protein